MGTVAGEVFGEDLGALVSARNRILAFALAGSAVVTATAVGTPIAGAAGAGATHYAFVMTNADGSPVRWDPCTTITWKANLGSSPAEQARLKAAVHEVAHDTGLTFSYAGSTRYVPDSVLIPPSEHAQLVVAFTAPGHGPARSSMLPPPPVLGEGGFSADGGDILISSSGAVALNQARLKKMPAKQRYEVYLHELGHVVGLAHVSDHRQVMYPAITATTPAHYAAGDLAGLAKLGIEAGCFTPPTPPPPASPMVTQTS